MIFVALGSNEGARLQHIEFGLRRLDEKFGLKSVSAVYETLPVGPAGQQNYFNLAAELVSADDPDELLGECQDIESASGRRNTIRWGPRTLDIDILLFHGEVRSSARLVIPHPEMHTRDFVLAPLCDIAPDVVLPLLGVTVAEQFRAIGRPTIVRCLRNAETAHLGFGTANLQKSAAFAQD